ncbi:hypothetical protein HDU98_001255 [Podochytrium sp. JEL0797]|nr:hypothetical protein HDU98_001255 [Podochytrium sp. JEL0797]
MSERKVLNKYFPPDFDPAKIPRRKMAADQQIKVRLMAPFSMRCSTCGDYVYKGKKFNARKEKVAGEAYLGIHIFRFYIRCPKCSAEITFKTDPKNSDYVCEHGAARNFEPWRDETDTNELKRIEKEKAEENNPMKALENRTVASKVEMDILDALDEIRTRNAQTERVDADAVLGRLQDKQRSEVERILRVQDDEDEALARAVFKSSDDGLQIRRLVDEDGGVESRVDSGLGSSSSSAALPKASVSDWLPAKPSSKKRASDASAALGLAIVSKKAKASAVVAPAAVAIAKTVDVKGKGKSTPAAPAVGLSGLAAYGSDDSDSE